MDEKMLYCYKARILKIVDGDTCDILMDLGCNVHIKERCRLYGINAPESFGVKKDSEEYKQGIAAKEYLRGLIEGKEVKAQTFKDKKGKYGRYLVDIYLPGETVSISTQMIAMGHAVEYFGGKR